MANWGLVRSGTKQGARGVALAGAVGAMMVIAGIASAGSAPPVLPFPPEGDPGGTGPATVRFATTGNHSELVESIPITRKAGAAEEVAMSLGPQRLPNFQAGDKLEVLAEVQPSTTCVLPGKRCVGRRYRLNPFIRSRLVLADAADPAAAAVELATARGVRCKQKRPNRNHHCAIAFRQGGMEISDPAALPCPPDACYINLLVGADHPKARPANKIVLGGDRPGGDVAQDRARLAATVVRADAPAPTVATDQTIRARGLRLNPRRRGARKRVIHSIEVPDLTAGEVVQATATYRGKIKRLDYNVFIGSILILATTPTSTDPTKLARTAGLRSEVTESNGFNCTRGRSGYRTPCLVEKAGAIRVVEDVVDGDGDPVSLYVNLVSRAKPKLVKAAKRRDKVKLRPDTGLRAVRRAAH